MKIFFLNRYFYPDHSATSQMLSDLAFHLAGDGQSVTVITSRQRYDTPPARLPARETIRGVEVYRVWTTRFGRGHLPGRAIDYLTFYTSVFWQLLRNLSRGDIVVAATDPPLISVVAAVVARLRGANLINWCHDLFPEVAAALGIRLAKGPAGIALKWLRNRSLRQAACNVVLGEHMAERVAGEGIARDRIKIIHNWADGETIKPKSSSENRIRHDWGLNGKFIVGYSGNLGRAHEFQTLLDAATALHEDEGIVFVIIGGGAQLDRIRRKASSRGLSNILFKPYQPRELLPETLTLIDLHVVSLLPSLEGLIVPSKFYGIAAAGRPILFIGAKDGELSRIAQTNSCGISVEIRDAERAVAAIQELARSQDRCERLGANARITSETHFSMSLAFGEWRQLLTATATAPAKERAIAASW